MAPVVQLVVAGAYGNRTHPAPLGAEPVLKDSPFVVTHDTRRHTPPYLA